MNHLRLTLPEGAACVTELEDGRRRVHVETHSFVSVREWTTRYPADLIGHVLRVKGIAHVCDEIMRDESPDYVQRSLEWALFSHVAPAEFDGARILDFGSGSGASAVVLARLLPGAREIVGVDLSPEAVELARHRAAFHGLEDRLKFHLSPGPLALPAQLGRFTHVNMSAVFEHLLPAERKELLPRVWGHLEPQGVLFLNQTPNRWFPVELHTTGIPLLNYLPAGAALAAARRFSARVPPESTWNELLRRGIRGGSGKEIRRILDSAGGAVWLRPHRLGVTDEVELWYRLSRNGRREREKRVLRSVLDAGRRLTGLAVVPTLTLAYRKPA